MPNEVTLPRLDAKAVLAVLHDARRGIEARTMPKARAQKEPARKRREMDLLAVNAAIRILADAIPETDTDTATLKNEASERDRMATSERDAHADATDWDRGWDAGWEAAAFHHTGDVITPITRSQGVRT